MASLPDYDPNLPNQNYGNAIFNRNTLGTYEPGSTFKVFNTAIALASGTATLNSQYDNSTPLRIGRFRPDDWRIKVRGLISVKEIFMYSSNIGSAKMALQFGPAVQKQYLGKFGFLKPPSLELPEIGSPIVPATWREVTTMTISYGYGLAVTPLQLLVAVAGIINDGNMRPATLIKRTPETVSEAVKIVSSKTSAQIRDLMRLVVTDGTAKVVDNPEYKPIAKTGSAHKKEGRGYSKSAKITSCIVAFPKDKPQYIVVVFLDNPKPTKNTYGFTTGGWNAAPTAGHIAARSAPLLSVTPELDTEETGKLLMQDNLMPAHYRRSGG
jgi:cell division protein FtsI (penicillin-binding protein 3)